MEGKLKLVSKNKYFKILQGDRSVPWVVMLRKNLNEYTDKEILAAGKLLLQACAPEWLAGLQGGAHRRTAYLEWLGKTDGFHIMAMFMRYGCPAAKDGSSPGVEIDGGEGIVALPLVAFTPDGQMRSLPHGAPIGTETTWAPDFHSLHVHAVSMLGLKPVNPDTAPVPIAPEMHYRKSA